jgi:hypothetical protein
MRPPSTPNSRLLLAGLFLTTLATMCLEVLDTRLLSVMAWYHLSFFAISTAMFGMAAGALRVYLGGAGFEGEGALRALTRHAAALAIAIPLAHLANLVVRIPSGLSATTYVALLVTTIMLAVPFYLSGVVVTIVLTRTVIPVGRAYAADLLGAALGGLLVIPLFAWSNLTTAVFACGAIAALAALCFARQTKQGVVLCAGLVLALVALSVGNARAQTPLGVWYVKDRYVPASDYSLERWNVHSRVVLPRQEMEKPFYWGQGEGAQDYRVHGQPIGIDGDALTVASEWNGDESNLGWVQHDVTSLPYHLRKGGDAAVLGVGGGRDILTALWARSRTVTGIEINSILLDLLANEKRDFTFLVKRPEVTLVHDEARSWISRTPKRFDVIQMSLIDTWASTAAGGYTLTENGLYTLEAFRAYLDHLKPTGVLSVSRWYDPQRVSETTRLLALGVASLIDRGVKEPEKCIALLARGQAATLLVSPSPLSETDLATLDASCAKFGFELIAGPGRTSAQPRLAAVAASTTRAQLAVATHDEVYDFSPPDDDRPFFFNMQKPTSAFHSGVEGKAGGVLRGNLQATGTLVALALISLALVLAAVFVPLLASGLPRMKPRAFLLGVAWFTAIGIGFMLVQIGLMQRLSVYLGHPTYAIIVILFGMILAAGAGAFVSDRFVIDERARITVRVPLLAAGLLLATVLAGSPLVHATIAQSISVRILIAIALVAPSSFVLGGFFPLGMRLVARLRGEATAWMWGINGAAGVLGSSTAVAISMWVGIDATLITAAVLYGSLAIVGPLLARESRNA